MSRGRYVVYGRSSRDEERLFLKTASEVVKEVEEPKSWAVRDPKKHAGSRPFEYDFRPMLLVIILMVRDRKDYREMASHLSNNPALVEELGLKRGPSKSSIHSAAARIGLNTLAEANDAILARFKKILEDLERST